MNKLKRQVISILLVLCLCISNFSMIFAQENGLEIDKNRLVAGKITVAIEKFTLGQGYYLEPINVNFYEGETFGNVLARVLGSGKYNGGKDTDNISYLDSVYDPNPGEATIPQYILDEIDEPDEFSDDDWLGTNDYYDMFSGWMYLANNKVPDMMNTYECEDGDVFRIQFSIRAGSDIGFDMWGGKPILEAPANKDKLTKLIAYINGRKDKQALLQKAMPEQENSTVQDWYDTAIEALQYMEVDQDTVDETYAILKKAIDAYKEPVGEITVAIEKFTLGQGYVVEPINVPFSEGEMIGEVMAEVLGNGNYNGGKDEKNISLLTNIKDNDQSNVNIPQTIMDKIQTVGPADEWLGDGDYSKTSCWMYYVNQQEAGIGMDQYPCKNGDVVRVQLSLYGGGADLGYGSDWRGPALFNLVSKSNLTKLVAAINSNEKREDILGNEQTKACYDKALAVLKSLEATKEEVNIAYDELKAASGISIVKVKDYVGVQKPSAEVNKNTAESMQKMLAAISKKYAASANEWAIMDMIAYGQGSAMSQSALDRYVEETKESLKDATQSTDLSKAAIIFTALGMDARSILLGDGETFDIIDHIANGEITSISDSVFALIAYDSGKYEVSGCKWDRADLIKDIKNRRLSDNGWTYWGDNADPDMTGMVLSALAPYYLADRDTYDVSEYVDKAITCLEKMQEEDGTFAIWGTKNPCSTAMAIVGLSAVGIDAGTDARFIKNNKSAVDGLVKFESKDHLFGNSDTTYNRIATEQGFRALVAYNGLKANNGAFNIYQFTKPENKDEQGTILKEETLELDQLDPSVVYVIPSKVSSVVQTTPQILTINNVEVKATTMRALNIKKDKGNQSITYTMQQDTQVVGDSNWDGKLILPTIDKTVEVNGEKIAFAIKVGGNVDLTLDKPDRLLLPGAKDSRIGYINADGKFNEITNIMTEDAATGLVEGKTEGKINVGNDVAIWTKHFTVFAVLEKNKEEHTGGGSGSSNNKITVYFKLVGDSKHGETGKHQEYETWLPETSYEVDKGTTVKEVFEMALSQANISYHINKGTYVTEINGLGEFDNGPKSGWLYTVNDKSPNVSFDQYILNEGNSIVWYYSDDYSKPYSSSGNSGVLDKLEKEKLPKEEVPLVEEVKETITDPINFEDVPETHWAKEYIDYLSSRSIIKGKDENNFAPNEKVTRAEFVMLLYRISGEKVEDATTDFTDVQEEKWFNEAIAWAVKAGITNGMGKNLFAPNKEITREQMAVMLAKFATYMKVELAQTQEKATFADNNKISDYATEAVSTMQQAGIIQGREKGDFAPKDAATRAETVKMLTVFLKQINK